MNDPANDPVEQSICAARDGVGSALGWLLEQYRPLLLHLAERELDSDLQAKEGASDLVQETFLEAHRDFRQFRGRSEAELKAWLAVMLDHNVARFRQRYRYTQKRDVRREVSLEAALPPEGQSGGPFVDPCPTPRATAEFRDDLAHLEAAVDRLPPHYAQVLRLVHREWLTWEEISAIMNRTPAALQKLWLRAIHALEQERTRGHNHR